MKLVLQMFYAFMQEKQVPLMQKMGQGRQYWRPDMFAENKAIMPYGDSVSAPSIILTDLTAYKQEKVIKTND